MNWTDVKLKVAFVGPILVGRWDQWIITSGLFHLWMSLRKLRNILRFCVEMAVSESEKFPSTFTKTVEILFVLRND